MSETGKPLIPLPGYLVIAPMSPVTIRPVDNATVAGYIDGVAYWPTPHLPVTIRDCAQGTASLSPGGKP